MPFTNISICDAVRMRTLDLGNGYLTQVLFPFIPAVPHRLVLTSKLRLFPESPELVLHFLKQGLLGHSLSMRRVIGQDIPECVENLCHHAGLWKFHITFDLQDNIDVPE
jgi:hypothetical protein